MKFKPENQIKPPGRSIRDYLEKLEEGGHISRQKAEKLIAENEEKQARLEKFHLPTFVNYGVFNDLDSALAAIPANKKDEKFLVRCAPKKPELTIQRIKSVSLDEIANFVNNLPNGKENYTIELREYWNANYGGTIVGDGKGKIIIEMAEEGRAELEKATAEKIKSGSWDAKSSGISFHWNEESTDKEKGIMIEAIKFFSPMLKRNELEKLKIYAEFVYSAENGFKFIDISDEDFWTKLDFDT